MQHVVIGAGEVGHALLEVLAERHDAWLRDVAPEGPPRADVVHIALPWSAEFSEVVADYEQSYAAALVVVHSTVPVGTCDERGWVHSPVRGRHPALAAGVRCFTKHFGGRRAEMAAGPFAACGIRVETHGRAAETEAAKLWELAQFGIQVAVEKAMWEWCSEAGLDPEVVYRRFAQTYNEGYAALGEARFVRPVLDHMPGPLGGHCVAAGARMLNHPLADLAAAVDAALASSAP